MPKPAQISTFLLLLILFNVWAVASESESPATAQYLANEGLMVTHNQT